MKRLVKLIAIMTNAVHTAEKTNLRTSINVEWRMMPEYVLKIKKCYKLTLITSSPCWNIESESWKVNGVPLSIKYTSIQETIQKQISNKTTTHRGKYLWSNIFNLLSPVYILLKNFSSNLSIHFQNAKLQFFLRILQCYHL